MLVIRLQRVGKKNQPYFRIVAADKRRHVQAKAIQFLGNFNPRSKELKFNKEEIVRLLKNGAQLSNRLSRILKDKLGSVKIRVIDRPARKPKAELKKEKQIEKSKASTDKDKQDKVETASKNKDEIKTEK